MNNLVPGIKIDEVLDDLMNRSLSDIIGTDFSNSRAALNVIEDDSTFTVDLAAPGLQKSDFDIKIEKQILTITVDNREDEETINFKRREYNYTHINRRISLPESLDTEAVKAQYKNGILNIEICLLYTSPSPRDS